MTTYNCTDGYADVEIEAETPEEAAQAYVDGGAWGEEDGTVWVDVTVTDEDGNESEHTITLDPPEPPCEGDEEHDWQSPYEVLGGLKENPGVWGYGGGVVIKTVCAHCGRYCIENTWAQRADTGEQGLTSTKYADADEESLAWVASRQIE